MVSRFRFFQEDSHKLGLAGVAKLLRDAGLPFQQRTLDKIIGRAEQATTADADAVISNTKPRTRRFADAWQPRRHNFPTLHAPRRRLLWTRLRPSSRRHANHNSNPWVLS